MEILTCSSLITMNFDLLFILGKNQTLTHMSKSLNNASYDLGSIHALQNKVVMFFNRRKLVFLDSKNIRTSPKRDSKHSLGFCTESSSQGALFPHWLHGEPRDTGEEAEMYEILWWNHPLPALILTLWTSEEYFSSLWREGESKNNCLQSFMNYLANRKVGLKWEKNTNSLCTDTSSFYQ